MEPAEIWLVVVVVFIGSNWLRGTAKTPIFLPTCRLNICVCPNGRAATGKACPTPLVEKCLSCDPGFDLTLTLTGGGGDKDMRITTSSDATDGPQRRCVPQRCLCKNGIPTSKCDDPKKPSCLLCKHGYGLSGGKCLKNQCTCPHGKPVATGRGGASCPAAGAVKCRSLRLSQQTQRVLLTLRRRTLCITSERQSCGREGERSSFDEKYRGKLLEQRE